MTTVDATDMVHGAVVLSTGSIVVSGSFNNNDDHSSISCDESHAFHSPSSTITYPFYQSPPASVSYLPTVLPATSPVTISSSAPMVIETAIIIQDITLNRSLIVGPFQSDAIETAGNLERNGDVLVESTQFVSAEDIQRLNSPDYSEEANSHPSHMPLATSAVPTTMTVACLLYTSPSPRDQRGSRMPSSA